MKAIKPPRIVRDKRYEPFQKRLTEEIVRTIRRHLEAAGMTGDRLAEVAREIAFDVCAIVDGSAVMELDGEVVRPVVTFAVDAQKDDAVFVDRVGLGSYTHELLCEIADIVFADIDR